MSRDIDPKKLVQEINLDKDAFKINVPFSMCISGPSQSGKSEFILNMIKYRQYLFTKEFHRIIYCLPETLANRNSEFFNRIQAYFPTAELVFGLPSTTKLNLDMNIHLPSLLIIDDMMNSFLDSIDSVNLLSVKCHHENISVIFTVQNYFSVSRYGKTIQRNVNLKVFFYNRLDLRELRNISLQINPNYPGFMESNFNFLFEKFKESPSFYILVDGHYRSKIPNLFIRSHIFPNEKTMKIQPIIFFPNPDFSKK